MNFYSFAEPQGLERSTRVPKTPRGFVKELYAVETITTISTLGSAQEEPRTGNSLIAAQWSGESARSPANLGKIGQLVCGAASGGRELFCLSVLVGWPGRTNTRRAHTYTYCIYTVCMYMLWCRGEWNYERVGWRAGGSDLKPEQGGCMANRFAQTVFSSLLHRSLSRRAGRRVCVDSALT